MKVFVWKSHGDIEIYAIDTIEQKTALVDSLCTVLEDVDSEDFISEGKSVGRQLIELEERVRWQAECGSDFFEEGSGFHEVKQ